jgi:hypothetical protein
VAEQQVFEGKKKGGEGGRREREEIQTLYFLTN